jgi:hypothetical protein
VSGKTVEHQSLGFNSKVSRAANETEWPASGGLQCQSQSPSG